MNVAYSASVATHTSVVDDTDADGDTTSAITRNAVQRATHRAVIHAATPASRSSLELSLDAAFEDGVGNVIAMILEEP